MVVLLFFDSVVIAAPIKGFCNCSVLLCIAVCPLKFCRHLEGEEKAGYFALFVFLIPVTRNPGTNFRLGGCISCGLGIHITVKHRY